MRPIARPENVRQTLLAQFDRCPLSARLAIRSERRQPSVLAARGTLAHRLFCAAVNEMRAHGEHSIGVDQAMEILLRVIAQRETPNPDGGWMLCPPEEVVHVPAAEIRWLRILAIRFANGHSFSIEKIVAVERRLFADVPCLDENGDTYYRTVSGQLDVLLAEPPDGAVVVDYKTGWAPPPEQRGREERDPEAPREDRLSDMGYAQQVIYGFLVLANYPAIQRVALREFYVMEDEDPVREASVERWQMERIQDVLSGLVSQFDAAIDADAELLVEQERAREAGDVVPQGRWLAAPGTHCGLCPSPRDCPIRDEVGIPADYEEASLLVGEWHAAGEARKERNPLVHGQINRYGEIELPHAKGRRVVGYAPGSKRLSIYEPVEAPESPFDPLLEEAARDAGVLVDG